MANLEKYEQAVERCRALLTKWFDAGIELFVELQKIEINEDWKTPDVGTFQDFLARAFPNSAVDLYVYNNVTQAIDLYGVERVRQVGPQGCHALLNRVLLESKEKRELVSASIDSHVRVNGTPPSRGEVRRIVHGVVATPSPQARSTRSLVRESSMALENRSLKEENAKLKRELAAEKRRAEQLEKKLAKLTPRERKVA